MYIVTGKKEEWWLQTEHCSQLFISDFFVTCCVCNHFTAELDSYDTGQIGCYNIHGIICAEVFFSKIIIDCVILIKNLYIKGKDANHNLFYFEATA